MKTTTEIAFIFEALSSCAIEGNTLAEKLLYLARTDYDKFLDEIEKVFPEEKKDE